MPSIKDCDATIFLQSCWSSSRPTTAVIRTRKRLKRTRKHPVEVIPHPSPIQARRQKVNQANPQKVSSGLSHMKVLFVCHCIGVFGDAVSSQSSRFWKRICSANKAIQWHPTFFSVPMQLTRSPRSSSNRINVQCGSDFPILDQSSATHIA